MILHFTSPDFQSTTLCGLPQGTPAPRPFLFSVWLGSTCWLFQVATFIIYISTLPLSFTIVLPSSIHSYLVSPDSHWFSISSTPWITSLIVSIIFRIRILINTSKYMILSSTHCEIEYLWLFRYMFHGIHCLRFLLWYFQLRGACQPKRLQPLCGLHNGQCKSPSLSRRVYLNTLRWVVYL